MVNEVELSLGSQDKFFEEIAKHVIAAEGVCE